MMCGVATGIAILSSTITQASVLTVHSIELIKPSSSLGGVAADIYEVGLKAKELQQNVLVEIYIAEMKALGIVLTSPALEMVFPVIAKTKANYIDYMEKTLRWKEGEKNPFHYRQSGTDELYVKLDGKKQTLRRLKYYTDKKGYGRPGYHEDKENNRFPTSEKKTTMKMEWHDRAKLNSPYNFSGSTELTLWERDTASSDDLLGKIIIEGGADYGIHQQVVLAPNKEEGSLYLVSYSVSALDRLGTTQIKSKEGLCLKAVPPQKTKRGKVGEVLAYKCTQNDRRLYWRIRDGKFENIGTVQNNGSQHCLFVQGRRAIHLPCDDEARLEKLKEKKLPSSLKVMQNWSYDLKHKRIMNDDGMCLRSNGTIDNSIIVKKCSKRPGKGGRNVFQFGL